MRRALVYLLCLSALTIGVRAQDPGALRLTELDFIVELEPYPFFFSSRWAVDAGRGVMERVAWRDLNPPLTRTVGGQQVQAVGLLTLRLRTGHQWADGSPITVYDVLYNFRARGGQFNLYSSPGDLIVNRDRTMEYAAVLDDGTFVFFAPTREEDDDQPLANFPIIPAAVFDPAFSDAMRAAFAGLTLDQADALFDAAIAVRDTPIHFDYNLYSQRLLALTTRFRFVDPDAPGFRLIINDLPITIALTDSSDPGGRVDDFLAGRYDVLVNPPFTRRSDLRRLANTRIVEPIGGTWYGLALNLFDPDIRLREEGVPLLPSPFLSDPRVRRAIALAIDVSALGEAATSGHYLPFGVLRDWRRLAQSDLRGDPPPEPARFDPAAARALLEEAGWKDWDRDGVRECRGCGTATEGTLLRLPLLYEGISSIDLWPEQRIMSRLLSEQFRRVGIELAPSVYNMFEIEAEVRGSRHSMALLRFTERDRGFINVARAFPQADVFIYLFSERELYAARTWVTGFDPIPGDPFWNINTWRLAR